jgi:hypothetical protein
LVPWFFFPCVPLLWSWLLISSPVWDNSSFSLWFCMDRNKLEKLKTGFVLMISNIRACDKSLINNMGKMLWITQDLARVKDFWFDIGINVVFCSGTLSSCVV